MEVELPVTIERQPDDTTCGPTALHGTKYDRASVHRLIGATFLGVGSDDGNLMRIRPKDWKDRVRIERS